MRIALRILQGLVFLVVGLSVIAFGYRALRQHENAQALAIHTPNGIEEAMFVKLGGIDQWIQIRGEDKSNPVLLIVHGGPGGSITPLSSVLRNWEKDFTVVMWDQRCAGKTFGRDGPESCSGMSIAGVAHEGNELAEFLRGHLHQNKIVALGHSWGTMIAPRMVHDRPDLYSAYVGTGQVVSIAEKERVIYARTMAKLVAAHDEAGIQALKAVGAPPYKSVDRLMVERDWSTRYDIPSERDLRPNMTPVALFAPGWSPWDLYEFLQAPKYAEAATFDADASYDARDLGPKFALPFFIFNGETDQITPTDLAKPYFDKIEAPHKEFVALKGAGHSAILTEPDVFLHELETRVRPLVLESATGAFHG